jgi:ABC-type Mn2+/Zn2+ transport system ATPase subunit
MGISAHQDKYLTHLSSGQRQSVFLACAILQKSNLLLLDEPTNHLDPDGKEQFWQSLFRMRTDENHMIGLSRVINTTGIGSGISAKGNHFITSP